MDTARTSALASPVTPALYPTRVTHLHRSPVRHYAEHRSYSWYVDLDDLPRLPWWLRPFARFEATDHFHSGPRTSLRGRVDAFLAEQGVFLPGGRITALLMPRVLGRAFNPLSLFWCHDAGGALRCVVAEVQTTGGARRAYLLPPGGQAPVAVTDTFDNAPFGSCEGYFLVRVPEPGEKLDLTVSLHRDNQAALVATWRGARRRLTSAAVLRLQFCTPMAPQMAELNMRLQAAMLRLRGAGRPAGKPVRAPERSLTAGAQSATTSGWRAKSRSWAAS